MASMRFLWLPLLFVAGCASPSVQGPSHEEQTAACREEYEQRRFIDGYVSIANVVELGGFRVEAGGRSAGVETTADDLRAAFGAPDSVRVNEYASYNPETDPDWTGAHPTSWVYPSFEYVMLPDSTAVLASADVAAGAAVSGDGLRLDGDFRRSSAAERFPKSWRCREGHPDNYSDFLFDNEGAEALTVIDTSATPGQRYGLSELTMMFENGTLVRVYD